MAEHVHHVLPAVDAAQLHLPAGDEAEEEHERRGSVERRAVTDATPPLTNEKTTRILTTGSDIAEVG
jgi:hypothetical protein